MLFISFHTSTAEDLWSAATSMRSKTTLFRRPSTTLNKPVNLHWAATSKRAVDKMSGNHVPGTDSETLTV